MDNIYVKILGKAPIIRINRKVVTLLFKVRAIYGTSKLTTNPNLKTQHSHMQTVPTCIPDQFEMILKRV